MKKSIEVFHKLKDIQELAQIGLSYSRDPYDIERFKKIQLLTLEIFALQSNFSVADLTTLFTSEIGYPTPKVGTRAAVFKDDKILLVKETMDNLWSMPGGWCDYNQSIKENIIKEVWEEASIVIEPTKIVNISSSQAKAKQTYYNIYRFFILGEISETQPSTFEPNIEISDCHFFALDELPPLSLKRNTPEHIKLCFDAYHADTWETIFD